MAARAGFKFTWEEAIEHLRRDPAHHDLIHDSYLGADLQDNCRRFLASEEFAETLGLLRQYAPSATTVLDIPGGNGIATHAFAKSGFTVTTVEPDPSDTVGRGAIARVLEAGRVTARVADAFGENLPFPDGSFDIVYIRQGLHHAADLPGMLKECGRVLRPGGLLLAAREHVVDDHGPSLASFLATQADHQLYGGEHAFTLAEYRGAMAGAKLERLQEYGPFDSVINLYPTTFDALGEAILASRKGRLLALLLPRGLVRRMGLWWLRRQNAPGRLYTFLATKPCEMG